MKNRPTVGAWTSFVYDKTAKDAKAAGVPAETAKTFAKEGYAVAKQMWNSRQQ